MANNRRVSCASSWWQVIGGGGACPHKPPLQTSHQRLTTASLNGKRVVVPVAKYATMGKDPSSYLKRALFVSFDEATLHA